VCPIVIDDAWKVCFVTFKFIIQDSHDAFGSITCTHWFLGQAGVLLEHSGDARLELQIANFLMSKRTTSIVMVFEVQHSA
jgi:hypothetical protein